MADRAAGSLGGFERKELKSCLERDFYCDNRKYIGDSF